MITSKTFRFVSEPASESSPDWGGFALGKVIGSDTEHGWGKFAPGSTSGLNVVPVEGAVVDQLPEVSSASLTATVRPLTDAETELPSASAPARFVPVTPI